jgi:hypothetical protein
MWRGRRCVVVYEISELPLCPLPNLFYPSEVSGLSPSTYSILLMLEFVSSAAFPTCSSEQAIHILRLTLSGALGSD